MCSSSVNIAARMAFQSWASASEEEQYKKALDGIVEDRVFFVIKANVFRNPMKLNEVFPVEISLACFSLSEGVISSMATLIQPDNVPSGLGYAMKELKDNTGLPRPGVDDEHFGDVHRDYEVIALAVKKFIARGVRRRPPGSNGPQTVFAMGSDIPDAQATLKWFANKCEGAEFEHVAQFLSGIVFLDFSRLFLKLCKYASIREKSYSSPIVQFEMDAMAANLLNKPSSYSFRSEISCQYHCETGYDKIDMCAKNWILKRIFTILDHLVTPLRLEKKKGHSIKTYCEAEPEEKD